MKIKLSILPFVASLLTLVSCGGNKEINNDKYNIKFRINETMLDTIFLNIRSRQMSFEFDWNEFINASPHEYHKNLAVLGSYISGGTDNNFNYDLYNEKTQSYTPAENFLSMLGVIDFKKIYARNSSIPSEENDGISSYLFHYDLTNNDTNYQIIIVASCGTTLNDEWISNFDAGYDDIVYYDASKNECPNWLNKENHKGFDVTANKLDKKIDEYVKTIKKEDSKLIYFLTGYSRGAAVTNILGKMFEDRSLTNFTYTYESPNVTSISSSKLKEYKNIYNIINGDDLVPIVPSKENGFARYGIDKIQNISSIIDKWNEMWPVNRPYVYPDKEKIMNVYNELIPSREQLYKIPDEYYPLDVSDTFSSEEECIKDYNAFVKIINSFTLSKFIYIEPPKESVDGWSYRWKYAPAIIFGLLEIGLKKNITALLELAPIFNKPIDLLTREFSSLIDLANSKEFIKKVLTPHLPEGFILLAQIL